MTSETKKMKITDGPAEFDLAVALMRGTQVSFSIGAFTVPVIINGLEIIEDGSRKSWLIKGRFDTKDSVHEKFGRNEFHGWYSYLFHRTGWIKIVPSVLFYDSIKVGTKLHYNKIPNEVSGIIDAKKLSCIEFEVVEIKDPFVTCKITKDTDETAIGKIIKIHAEKITSDLFEIID